MNVMQETILPMFYKLWWMVLIVALVPIVKRWLSSWFNDPKRKGDRAEKAVADRLKRRLPAEYKVLNNVYLPQSDGTTAQIDHIVVSRYGVFVIETKNYSGWIFGNADDAEWTQTFYRKRSTFQNPLRQNDAHVFALVTNLRIDKSYFHNVVALTDTCEFMTMRPENVTSTRWIVEFILSFDEPLMTASQVDEIAEAIAECDGSVSEERKANHVANLKKRHSATRTGVTPACPYCGGRMVLRTRKRDGAKFYGCASYPACHGTVDITSLGNPWEQNVWGQPLAPP